MSLATSAQSLKNILNRPGRVLIWAVMLAALYVGLDGNLYRIYEIRADQGRTRQEIRTLKSQLGQIRRSMSDFKDPRFLEREALERFDLAGEDDLIFVFSN